MVKDHHGQGPSRHYAGQFTCMTNLFLDTETIGFSPCHLMSFAAIIDNDDGREVARLSCYVQPYYQDEVSAGAFKIHGLTKKYCDTCGLPIKQALSIFSSLSRENPMVVAHNIKFDTKVLQLAYSSQNLEIPAFSNTYCTMERSTAMVRLEKTNGSGYKWPKLSELHRFLFDADFENQHTAFGDCLAMRKCYYELRRRGDILQYGKKEIRIQR